MTWIPSASAALLIPSEILVQKMLERLSVNTATVCQICAARIRVKSYPSLVAVSIISRRFASLTRPLPDRALEIVAVESFIS